jgi:hypothetical protein
MGLMKTYAIHLANRLPALPGLPAKTSPMTAKPKTHLTWADFDPCAPAGIRWAYYRSKAEQRANRPDLPAIRVRIIPLSKPAAKKGGAA